MVAVSKVPSMASATRSTTPPQSPRGYTNQPRIPRPESNLNTRLGCCLLNFLQGNIPRPRGFCPNFFKVQSTNGYELFTTRLLPTSPTVTTVGLSAPGLANIKIEIRVWKAFANHENHYQIEAFATCCTRTDGIIREGRKVLRSELTVGWWIPENENSSDLEHLEWEAVLRLLRRAGKRNFNMYGEDRSQEEAEEFDQDQVALFYIGDRARVLGEY
ncbi:hypothetical protein N431DRAFT_334203 [Stipitochalara longipes BDJ]|nr:hypothetical protein N431DRAFT_334203 [Stipitochalara longipes BDJ]